MVSNRELPDDQMIGDSMQKNPFPAWLYLALIALLVALLWGFGNWFYVRQELKKAETPFLQVTNRQFSLFLWQFPEYMRSNVSSKTGYLPGFQYIDKVAVETGLAEEYVVAPPQVLFLYHTWQRLIGDEFARRPISTRELREFLEYSPEWKPENWPKASKDYAELIARIDPSQERDIPLKEIPNEVQQAFIGWKNFLIEGEMINQVKPSYEKMGVFLKKFPNYARNFWRNIVAKGKPEYLKSIGNKDVTPTDFIPEEELASFLKVAFFNFIQSEKNL